VQLRDRRVELRQLGGFVLDRLLKRLGSVHVVKRDLDGERHGHHFERQNTQFIVSPTGKALMAVNARSPAALVFGTARVIPASASCEGQQRGRGPSTRRPVGVGRGKSSFSPDLAPQLVKVGQPVGMHASSNRTVRFVSVGAIAESALEGQGGNVGEARLQTSSCCRFPARAARRVDDARASGERCRDRTVVVCRPRLSSARTTPIAWTACPSSVLVSVDFPAPDEPSMTSVWPGTR